MSAHQAVQQCGRPHPKPATGLATGRQQPQATGKVHREAALGWKEERENLSKQRLPEPSAPSPPRSAAAECWAPRCHARAQGRHACVFTHNTHAPTHTRVHTQGNSHTCTHTLMHPLTHVHTRTHMLGQHTGTQSHAQVCTCPCSCVHTLTYTKYTFT